MLLKRLLTIGCVSVAGFTYAQEGLEPITKTIEGSEVSFKMVPIPAGTFTVGSPEGAKNREEDEGPVHQVALEAFYMSETEVTWELYELFTDKDKRATLVYVDEASQKKADAMVKPSTPYLDPSYGMGKYGFPATSMTQYAAVTFCKWLSETTGEFYRLPTEAEWEYACRAGSTTAYSFGDNADSLKSYAWFYDNSNDKYHEVKGKKPNAWGLYDMHGNVMEWTLDQYQADYYATVADGQTNPWRKPTNLHPRSARGGSWDDDPEDLRSANRTSSTPNWQKRDPQIPKSFWWASDAPFVGIRLVKPAKQPTKAEQAAFWASVLDEG
ncbi:MULTISPECIES: SUMF1/EgtB/PvdO family nonheme iron enzyme [unclassified Imperialibacter]|uniref:formylglycine-generating enzyme family protein n=1 Tax=unclassified Imperialibacter TaxID=2629706 RepID=UPI001251E83B|nr:MULTISPECIES: SUMF1/EgtB/PvdO family nonheme iron enzyme [unclassified Imperialibacter]CAD5290840.1 Sulfatase-modifying factor protein [Imperialibacter sp. 89]CAD5291097.1 Sulfatase-modifying factor protein [Imperialibacter sp. 75]VVT34421.1 Sulfatase-modifying factor protein [Imperialibacter sp. EC-SDR9]